MIIPSEEQLQAGAPVSRLEARQNRIGEPNPPNNRYIYIIVVSIFAGLVIALLVYRRYQRSRNNNRIAFAAAKVRLPGGPRAFPARRVRPPPPARTTTEHPDDFLPRYERNSWDRDCVDTTRPNQSAMNEASNPISRTGISGNRVTEPPPAYRP